MSRLVIISGCSGGGKSTLLAALHDRGYPIVDEPGRRIVKEELDRGGTALPWIDVAAFARRAIAMALADREAVSAAAAEGWVFFDRGLIDAASALRHVGGDGFIDTLKNTHRYNPLVFLTPPWPEIYRGDDERRHGFDAAVEEYERLVRDYEALGYDSVVLPKSGIEERADFILARIG